MDDANQRTKMTEPKRPISVGIREILRWWPVLIAVTLMAIGAAIWTTSRQAPSYTATARLMVIPLAQTDETFLGTSLVRDPGDSSRTASTVATQLNSRRAAMVTANYLGKGWTAESVGKAVKVTALENTTLIEIVARSTDPGKAATLAEGFATAILADRWKTISAELDRQIAAVTATADPNAGDGSTRLVTLKMVRDSGSDPTMRMDATTPAVRHKQLPSWLIVGLAAAGGLFVGLLAATGMAMLRRRTDATPQQSPPPAPNVAYSPNGGRRTPAARSRR
jgi:uncharacterized protein involved in exopolysaccharide biosynthesis